jgi:DNA/RNA endonuclease YhcR with UshA esterase domain
MKKLVISFIFLFFIFIASAYAQDQISSKDAKDHVGESANVKGKVASIYTSEKGNTFINFDDKSPDQSFTVVVFSESKVDISKITEGCTLTVYGEIKLYKGKPEIVVDKSEQIISIE